MDKICNDLNCDKPMVARQLCKSHYSKYRKAGKLFKLQYPAECTVDDCNREHSANGYCSLHDQRVKAHGSIDGDLNRNKPGEGTILETGYWADYDPPHPLARKNGMVLRHRKLLYEEVGPGWHQCHWCEDSVQWTVGFTTLEDSPIVVDHVDEDRQNNDLTNLVVSCIPCNAGRRHLAFVLKKEIQSALISESLSDDMINLMNRVLDFMEKQMRLLISLPIYKRDWILPHWFAAIEKQDIDLSDIGFSFQVASMEEDPLTHELLLEWFSSHPQVQHFVLNNIDELSHRHHENGRRVWNVEAYNKMSMMRNALLETATSLQPDYYFSLDSDIILEDPQTLTKLMALAEPRCAVSPLMYMKHYGVSYPSVMSWVDKPGGKAYRNLNAYKQGTNFNADIIMAAVMMSKEVYENARYFPHPQGEDLGFAADCARFGFNLISAQTIYCPHIMHESSASMPGIKGPGILDVYLRSGDDRGLC